MERLTIVFLIVCLVGINAQCMIFNCAQCSVHPECHWCSGADMCMGGMFIGPTDPYNVTEACVNQFTSTLYSYGSYSAANCSITNPVGSIIGFPDCIDNDALNFCPLCKYRDNCSYCAAPGGKNMRCWSGYGKGWICRGSAVPSGTQWWASDCYTAVQPQCGNYTTKQACLSQTSYQCGWCQLRPGFEAYSYCSTNQSSLACISPNVANGTWVTALDPTLPVDLVTSSSASSAVVVGAVVGVVLIIVVLAIVGILLLLFFRRQKQRKATPQNVVPSPNDDKDKTNYNRLPAPFTDYTDVGSNSGGSKGSQQRSDTSLVSRTSSSKYKSYAVTLPPAMKEYTINAQDLKFEQEIGRGAYGIVFRAKWRGTPVAVKQVISENLSEIETDAFLLEVNLMKSLRPHDNVVLLMGVCENPLSLVTEFLEGGSLLSFLYQTKEKKDEVSLQTRIDLVFGIARGMLHLHLENIIHRDLAARNVLLTKSKQPKISDFGMSRVNISEDANKTQSNVGPIKWMAPESIKTAKYSLQSDVWSFGVVVVEILTHDIPYPGVGALQAANLVTSNQIRPHAPEQSIQLFKDLVSMCCEFDSTKRPSFQYICDFVDAAQEKMKQGNFGNTNTQTQQTQTTTLTERISMIKEEGEK